MRLARNANYWGTSAVAYDEIRYEFVADENAEFTRFRAGQLDVTNSVPEQRFQELALAAGSGLQHRATLATFYFTMNTERGPLRGLGEDFSASSGRTMFRWRVTSDWPVPPTVMSS